MAKRALRSFTVSGDGKTYTIRKNQVFANSHPVTSTHSAMFETITELSATALGTPANVANGTPLTTSCPVTWDAVPNATYYTVTTTPSTTTHTVTTNSVNLTGLTTATGYTVSVVAKNQNPFMTQSAAGTDTFTTA